MSSFEPPPYVPPEDEVTPAEHAAIDHAPLASVLSPVEHAALDHTGIPGVGGGGSAGVTLLGYAIGSGNQTGIAGTGVDLSGMSKQVTVAANRLIRITVHCHPSMAGPGPTVAQFEIKEGATQLGVDRLALDAAANGSLRTLHFETILVAPSAGVHTYKVVMSRDAGPETLNHTSGATAPSFMVIEDVGPS